MNIEYYQQLLNLQDATFSLIQHEDAIVATVYKIKKTDGSELILKICETPKHLLCEAYFLKHFASQLPVPKILQVVNPTANIPGAILIECLPGAILKKPELTEPLAYEMGSLLARIHMHATPGYGNPLYPDELTQKPHSQFTLKFEEEIKECSPHLSQDLIEECLHYHHEHLHLLDSVDGPCMTHRDFRPGNMIVHEGKLQGIIDWSSGRFSFAEEDFLTLECGEFSSHAHLKASFLAGYASIRSVPDFKRVMPLLRLRKAIGVIGFTLKRNNWQSSTAHLYEAHRRFLDTFFKA